MRIKKSLLIPIITILSGILLQLKSLGIIGDVLSDNLLGKLWPVLLAAAALDLLFTHKRLIGALILGFFAAALLSTQFMAGGWNNDLWKLFMNFWPILLILYGVDSIFAGRSLLNAAVVIAAVVVLAYVLLTVLDIPALGNLSINLPAILPTASFNGPTPGQGGNSQQSGIPGMSNIFSPQQNTSPIVNGRGGQISYDMPAQNSAQLTINAATGKVAIGPSSSNSQFLSGQIELDAAERLTQNTSLDGSTAVYTLQSNQSGNVSKISNWELALSAQRRTALNLVMNNGYLKADLRSLNLSAVNIENKYGPVDVMVPVTTSATIKINISDGDLRVYVPAGGRVSCVISGTSQVQYPTAKYQMNGGRLTPLRATQTPVVVEIYSNNGSIQIIDNG